LGWSTWQISGGRLGHSWPEQLDWLEKDVKGLRPVLRLSCYAIPLWAVYPNGALTMPSDTPLCEAVRVRDCFKWAHSPGHAEGGRQHYFPPGYSLLVTNTGSVPKPLPVVVDAPQLKKMLGLTSVNTPKRTTPWP
jgi:hypothetical protein